MDKIIITQQAIQQIITVSRSCPTEIGGLLVGTVNHPVVLVAGDPGPKAQLKAASFTTDSKHDRLVLQQAREQFDGRVAPIGYWHKHPAGMNRPSGGDLKQAQMLVGNLKEESQSWLLVIIVDLASRTKQVVFPYAIEPPALVFHLLQLEVVPDDAPIIRRALQAEPVYWLPERDGSFWHDPDFRFHLTPAGLQRLRQEKQQLEAMGYQVQVQQRKDNRRVSFLVKRGEKAWLFVPPVEYPLGMPRIYRLPEQIEEFPFRMMPVWNSDLSFFDCLTVLQQKPAEASELLIEETPAEKVPTEGPQQISPTTTIIHPQPTRRSWFVRLLVGMLRVKDLVWSRR